MATSKKKDKKPKTVLKVVEGIVPATGKEPHADLRRKVIELKTSIDNSRWQLSEVLFTVYDETIYQRWGYNNFDQYVVTELDMVERTAQYLVAMYNWFVNKLGPELSPEDKERMIEGVKLLGWTKARTLIGVTTAENVHSWIERAKELSSTELQNVVRKTLMKEAGGDPKDVENIKRISIALAEEQHDIVMQALGLAETKAESNKKGHLLSLICQDYVATEMAQTSSGQAAKGKYFDRIGAQFGVQLVAVDIETGKVVHNKKVLDRIKND